MPNFYDVIEDFGCGSDLSVERIVEAVPAGTSLTRAWLLVKRRLQDPLPVVQKAITAVATADGQITDTGAGDQQATVLFILTGEDTVLLLQPHWFEIIVMTVEGLQHTVSQGIIRGMRTASMNGPLPGETSLPVLASIVLSPTSGTLTIP